MTRSMQSFRPDLHGVCVWLELPLLAVNGIAVVCGRDLAWFVVSGPFPSDVGMPVVCVVAVAGWFVRCGSPCHHPKPLWC